MHPMNCCGVHEISGISRDDPVTVLIDIYNAPLNRPGNRGGFLIFTARAEPMYKYGENFKNYINEYRLGNVIESHVRNNQRYIDNGEREHLLKIYIWEIDRVAFAKWYDTIPKPIVAEAEEPDDEYNEDDDY